MVEASRHVSIVEEEVRISLSHGGSLRGVLRYDEAGVPRGKVLLCCPHPFLAGTPENPVLVALGDGLARGGLASLAWEYASREESLGVGGGDEQRLAFLRDHRVEASGLGDLEDAAHVIAWLEDLRLGGGEECVGIAGYSYGGALALMLARTKQAALAVSPPLRALPAEQRLAADSVLVLIAESDLAVSPEERDAWLATVEGGPVAIETLPATDHFFRNALEELRTRAACWARSIGDQ